MSVNEARQAGSFPARAQREEEPEDMLLSEFDAPRSWMPAGELSLLTAAVFFLVAVIAWLR